MKNLLVLASARDEGRRALGRGAAGARSGGRRALERSAAGARDGGQRVLGRGAAGAVAVALLTLVSGCASSGGHTAVTPTEIDCPDDIQSQVRLSASAVPLTFPAALNINAGSPEHPGLVARRVMVAVAPTGAARGMRIFSTSLSLTTIGGTLAGWASIGHDLAASNAVDIIPGRLRMQPFVPGSRLTAQTVAVDVFVTPGSAPIDESVITTGSLWNAEHRATAASNLQITLTPVRHLTVFDVVEGTLVLELTAAAKRSAQERWRCSITTQFQLIDHESVLPNLWVLRKSGQRGVESQWLAFNDPTTGPFRAVFSDVQSARGFAGWLRETRAQSVGPYQLGLFRPNEPNPNTPLISRLSVAVPFHGIAPEELQTLEVKRLGE
jgi:hypothetical protein